MDLKTNVDLSTNEVAELFALFSESLRTNQSLELPLGDSKLSISVSKDIQLEFEINQSEQNNFLRLTINWEKIPEELSKKSEDASDLRTAAMSNEKLVTAEESSEILNVEPIQPKATTTINTVSRQIPSRVPLNVNYTHVLSGKYVSAFSKPSPRIWASLLNGDSSTPSVDEQEDLFSDVLKEKNMPNNQQQPKPIDNKYVTEEASSTNIEWQEPKAEDNYTDDQWAKPSDILKHQREDKVEAVSPPNPKVNPLINADIPSPKNTTSSNSSDQMEMKPDKVAPNSNIPLSSLPEKNVEGQNIGKVKTNKYNIPAPSIPKPEKSKSEKHIDKEDIPEGAPVPPDKKKKLGWSGWEK